MSNAHELKSLQVKATRLEVEVADLESEKQRIGVELGKKKNELHSLRQKLESLADKEPIVTEHALLRYIERVMGVDLDMITATILTEQNKKTIAFAGSCRIKSGGVEFVVKDRRVISVVA